MTHRHYGLSVSHARATPGAVWSGSAFTWAMMIIVLVLGVIIFELSMTSTPAPGTTGQGDVAASGRSGTDR